jgi:hypothetical protein
MSYEILFCFHHDKNDPHFNWPNQAFRISLERTTPEFISIKLFLLYLSLSFTSTRYSMTSLTEDLKTFLNTTITCEKDLTPENLFRLLDSQQREQTQLDTKVNME